MATDGPRVIPGIRSKSWSWKWWPGPDRFAKRIRTAQLPEGRGSACADPSQSNQRHADFQYNGEAGSARVSRRPGTSFRWADRTARPTEPIPNRSREFRRNHAAPSRSQRLSGISTEHFPNRAAELGRAGFRLTRPRHLEPRPPKFTTLQSGRYTVKNDPEQTYVRYPPTLGKPTCDRRLSCCRRRRSGPLIYLLIYLPSRAIAGGCQVCLMMASPGR